MVYSEVVANGLILPRKEKYTMHDVNKVLVTSLFSKKTLSEVEAVFVVKCSAIYHNSSYSDTIKKFTHPLLEISAK